LVDQCHRNHALVRALIKAQKVDNAYFVLVHHEKNVNIVAEWDSYNEILADKAKQENIRISAEQFVRKSRNTNYKKYFTGNDRISHLKQIGDPFSFDKSEDVSFQEKCRAGEMPKVPTKNKRNSTTGL
jgi:hypothetical protein